MNKSKTYEMAVCAMMAAIMCILGPLVVPIGPIPVSLTNLVLYFAIFILTTRATLISFIIYLLLGAVGIPVFSGYQGGIQKLTGPTGGYLFGFIFMIIIMGIAFGISKGNVIITALFSIIATAVAYAFGTAWFVIIMKCSVGYALTLCVYPFIGIDIAKIVIAAIAGKAVRSALVKADLIEDFVGEK